MARQKTSRRPEDKAIYACINPCTITVGHDAAGNAVHKLYKTASEVELSESQLTEGGLDGDSCYLKVSKGTIVPHHFAPENDAAYDDREDQLNNPEKYITDECDLIMIAELMVDEGWFRDKMKTDEKGRAVIEKIDVNVACDSIRAQMGAEKAALIADGQDMHRMKLYNELIAIGKDEKETRSKLLAMLKEGGVNMYKGAETAAFVNRILEEELYTG